MKRIVWMLVICAVLLAGCNGVILNAEYSRLLDETAAISRETAARARQGRLDPNQMAEALTRQADVWQKFRDARDGAAADRR